MSEPSDAVKLASTLETLSQWPDMPTDRTFWRGLAQMARRVAEASEWQPKETMPTYEEEGRPTAVDNIEARLRRTLLNEDVMAQWAKIRQHVKTNNGSLPRDMFEAMLESFDEERTEAADKIEALLAQVEAAERMKQTLRSTFSTREPYESLWAVIEADLERLRYK